MSEAQIVAALRARLDAVRVAVERAEQGGGLQERGWVRGEIVALFRETEELLERLTGIKEEIRPLVERYKTVFRGTDDGATPQGTQRIDHLGASTYLERGWSAIAGADYAVGERELRRALELAPGDARAEALLGWALMRQDRVAEARAVLEGVLAREPRHDVAGTCLGYVLLREQRFAEAVEQLSGVLRSGADRTAELFANLYLGMVYADREMHRDAEIFFERAIELSPGLAEAYWELGRARFRAGDRGGAVEAWTRGAAANRYNPWGERCKEAVARLRAEQAAPLE